MRTNAPSLDDLKQMAQAGLVIGYAGGAALAAMLACGLFYLVDFSDVWRDLLVLSFYLHVHCAVAGTAVGLTAVLIVAGVHALGKQRPSVLAFQRGLVTFMFGGVLLIIAGMLYIIARRPIEPFSGGVLLPLVGGVFLVFMAAKYSAGRVQNDIARGCSAPPLRHWRRIVAASLLLPPLFGALRGSGGHRPTVLAEDTSCRRIGSSRRLLVVGWDGATWDLIDPLIRLGRLPTLARLLGEGSRGVLWATPEEIQPFANSASGGARSPAMWETIATGKSPRQHGIWDFEAKLVIGVTQPLPFRIAGQYLGRTVPASAELARAQRVWDILARSGVSTAVIGWPNTWPVSTSTAGILVSDRAAYRADNSIYPPEAIDVTGLLQRAEGVGDATFDRLVFPLAPGRATDEGPAATDAAVQQDLAREFRSRYRIDLLNAYAAIQIAERTRPDFLAVYFDLPDVVQHKFWRFYQPEYFGDVAPADAARYGDVIPAAYELLDRLLGQVISAMGEDATLLFLSDHGGGPWVVSGLESLTQKFFKTYHPEYSGNHRLNGVVLMRGPDVRKQGTIKEGRQTYITPTILYLMGLPVGADMEGKVLTSAIAADRLEADPLRTIATYETGRNRRPARPKSSPADEAIREHMRSLGYIK